MKTSLRVLKITKLHESIPTINSKYIKIKIYGWKYDPEDNSYHVLVNFPEDNSYPVLVNFLEDNSYPVVVNFLEDNSYHVLVNFLEDNS